MNNKIISFLIFSIILNIFFISISLIITARRGGFIYVIQNFLQSLKVSPNSKKNNYPAYYWHKKDQYEKLTTSSSDIIMLGDSITDEGEWVELLNNSNIKNRGISGDTIERVIYRLDSVITAKPKQLFLMIGVNDLVNEKKTVQQTAIAYEKLLEKLQQEIPLTEIFLQSVLPVHNEVYIYWQDNQNIIELNLKIQDLGRKFNYKYLDIHSHLLDSQDNLDLKYTSDGLHLNGDGYLVWKSILEKYINE
jgi:lysophospholipase L1-like esterase